MQTTISIRQKLSRYRSGSPFSNQAFLQFGSRQAVDTAFSRLAQEGLVVRIFPGIYMKPKHNKYVGYISPNIKDVLAVIAKNNNETIIEQDVVAARHFGLTTQVPGKEVFYTSGTTRKVKIENSVIFLKHVSPSKLQYAGTQVGLAISALRYIGKDNANSEVIDKICNSLSDEELAQLKAARTPAWMAAALRSYSA